VYAVIKNTPVDKITYYNLDIRWIHVSHATWFSIYLPMVSMPLPPWFCHWYENYHQLSQCQQTTYWHIAYKKLKQMIYS